MRHTFVRQALVDGVPIEVASELAGHASIDTTFIYSTQELARKILAVWGMRRRVAAELPLEQDNRHARESPCQALPNF